jgi:hypothetical protein
MLDVEKIFIECLDKDQNLSIEILNLGVIQVHVDFQTEAESKLYF